MPNRQALAHLFEHLHAVMVDHTVDSMGQIATLLRDAIGQPNQQTLRETIEGLLVAGGATAGTVRNRLFVYWQEIDEEPTRPWLDLCRAIEDQLPNKSDPNSVD